MVDIISTIPTTVFDAWWALVLAVIGFGIAWIQNIQKKEVIAFFDPKDNTVVAVPEGVEGRSWQMSESTKSWLTTDLTPENKAMALAQVEAAEAAGRIEYTIVLPNQVYWIEYGLIKGSTSQG
jgi:hypothetical protein